MFFVYKVVFTNTGEYYIGGKYNKRADQSELGKTYFTSSTLVQQMLFKHGTDNVVFEILAEYPDKEECRLFEYSLIKEHRDDEFCLNRQGDKNFAKLIKDHHKNGTYDNRNVEASKRMKRNWENPEFREKMVRSTTGRTWNFSEEYADNRRKQLREMRQSGKVKYDNVSGTIWVNDGSSQKRVSPDAVPHGFVKGRL